MGYQWVGLVLIAPALAAVVGSWMAMVADCTGWIGKGPSESSMSRSTMRQVTSRRVMLCKVTFQMARCSAVKKRTVDASCN